MLKVYKKQIDELKRLLEKEEDDAQAEAMQLELQEQNQRLQEDREQVKMILHYTDRSTGRDIERGGGKGGGGKGGGGEGVGEREREGEIF